MCSFLLCALFLCLVAFANSDTSAGCESAQSWTQDVADEQAINMLQVKGSKLSSKTRQCPIPDFPAFYGYGKGCPESVANAKREGASCLEGNRAFKTFAEAWVACGRNDECEAVLQSKDNQYYLRRSSDPDLPAGQGYYLSKYDCPEMAEEHAEAEAQLKQDEHDDLVDEARRKQHKERIEAEIEEMAASYSESEQEEKKHGEQAMIHEIKGGGLPDDELALRVRILESLQAELGDLFEKSEDTACGWGNLEHCQDKNQAYVNSGARDKHGISRDQAMQVCGSICQEAGTKCGGFTYDNTTSACYFRKDTGCGVYARKGQDCIKKKAVPTPIGADDKLTQEELNGDDY